MNTKNPKSKTVLIIGDLVEKHKISELVAVFSSVSEKVNLNFAIAGATMNVTVWLQKVAEYGLSEKVVFLPTNNAEEIAQSYKMCDLFVEVGEAEIGDSEVHKLAILEAMRYTKPVVTTRQMDRMNVVRNGKNAITVSGERRSELSATIVRLLKNERMRGVLAKQGYNYVINSFDFSMLSYSAWVAYDQVAQFITPKAV